MKKDISHRKKIEWMATWAAKNHVQLELEGQCGFRRECVGIIAEGHYPDYYWYDDDYNRIDNNGKVWVPPDAYYKHECIAVLSRGKEAEEQLYKWLKWFDENNFVVEKTPQTYEQRGLLNALFHGLYHVKMVKKCLK